MRNEVWPVKEDDMVWLETNNIKWLDEMDVQHYAVVKTF